ncbi:MAG: hypothetical protein WCQ52_08385 [Actinomycetes bacterium]
MSENQEPIVLKMPAEYYSPELTKIWALMQGVDGYSNYGEQLGDLANRSMRDWHENGTLSEDSDFLLACLFYESRRSRFVSGYPAELDMPYLQALAKVIES